MGPGGKVIRKIAFQAENELIKMLEFQVVLTLGIK